MHASGNESRRPQLQSAYVFGHVSLRCASGISLSLQHLL